MTGCPISFAIIVGNDLDLFGECFDQLAAVVDEKDEVIIVTNGDAPPSIQVPHTNRTEVVHLPGASESEARNRCLREAQCEWILILDTDERLIRREIDNLRDSLRAFGLAVSCVVLPVIQYFTGGAASLVHVTRVIRNLPSTHFTPVGIHDTIGHSLPQGSIRQPSHAAFIRHMDEVIANRSQEKRLRNSRKLEDNISQLPEDHPRRGAMYRMLAQEYLAMERYEEAEQAVLVSRGVLASIADEDIAVYHARALFGQRRYDEALEIASSLSPRERGPRIQLRTILLDILVELNRDADAKSMVREDLNNFPGYAYAWVNAAHYTVDQDTKKEMLLKAVKLDPYLAMPDIVTCPPQPSSLFQSQSCLIAGADPWAVQAAEAGMEAPNLVEI